MKFDGCNMYFTFYNAISTSKFTLFQSAAEYWVRDQPELRSYHMK